jgi:cell division protease FtsH
MNPHFRNFAIWVIIGLLLVALFNLFQNPAQSRRGNEIPYSDFLNAVESRTVSEVLIQGNRISGKFSDTGLSFSTYAPEDPGLVERLRQQNIKIAARPSDEDVPSFLSVLVSWFPMLLLIAVWVFFMRQMQSGSGRAMGFGKSKAKLLTERHGRVTFDDVAGVDEAKADLQEIVEFLRDPQKFQRLGGRIPRGALLVGPPGTGKTLLARAIAGEANVPFFTISGSDFVEMFVGVGASRVRDMFEQAKKNAPCIIFIDEIDAVGRHRGAGLGGGNDEREQTLNQLLVEMDGFEANEGIILIAATNRPDVLDPALLRPGRFDRQIVVPNPDVTGREKILRVHMRKVPLAPDVDPKVIARGTPGFSGADLANLVNEAALLAARRNKRLVTQQEFEDAKDKVMMGAERRSMAMTEEEKLATAYHEAGHALVNILMPGGDPLHKVTIIPRGRALGVTMSLPERDKLSYSKQWCEAKIAMCFGGRVAEQIVYGKEHLNTGASSDIMQATDLARRMVTEWGMSEVLGPLRYNDNQQEVFLGHAITQRQNMSEETARLIDQEIRRIVTEGEKKAWEILSAHRKELEAITQALMEFETITGEECLAVMRGEKIVRRDDDEDTKGPVGSAVPTAGRIRPREEPDAPGGMEPQPQV